MFLLGVIIMVSFLSYVGEGGIPPGIFIGGLNIRKEPKKSHKSVKGTLFEDEFLPPSSP
jgi:hypothetical protein